MLKKLLILSILSLFNSLKSQELSCRVSVQTPTLIGLDKNVVNQMQQDITQYINTRKWTKDQFDPNERIKCSINIILTGNPSPDRFEGTAQVQVIRPAFNSTYETLILNFQDKYFNINYIQSQNLVYSETNYESNLTSLLNYYCLIILGIDYDTFGNAGGNPFYQRALNIINLAASQNETGWKAYDGDGRRNRYWLVENNINNSYKSWHEAMYKYHREGIDKFAEDPVQAREKIVEALEMIQKMYIQNPNIYLIQILSDTKNQEFISIFKSAYPDIQTRFLKVMEQIDPSKMNAYNAILEKTK